MAPCNVVPSQQQWVGLGITWIWEKKQWWYLRLLLSVTWINVFMGYFCCLHLDFQFWIPHIFLWFDTFCVLWFTQNSVIWICLQTGRLTFGMQDADRIESMVWLVTWNSLIFICVLIFNFLLLFIYLRHCTLTKNISRF